ncbi:MAG: PilZ domain-containing protein [Candidatus Omnitrophota bacterium]
MSEKRAYDRLAACGEATLKTVDETAPLQKGGLEDISFGGFAISLQEKMEPSAAVNFNLTISTAGELFCGKGIVRHATENSRYNRKTFIVGVEFTEVNKDIVTYVIKKVQAKLTQQKKCGEWRDHAAGIIPY